MNWIITKNNKPVKLKDIPVLPVVNLRTEIISRCGEGKRVISFFANTTGKNTSLFTALADDENSQILVSSARLTGIKSYRSITPEVPSFHMFERQLYEETGVIPEGHPWLKYVRFGFNRFDLSQTMENYPFFTMHGEEVHEVAVGPIHAGVIEPGHFRFMCHGEDVYHLEIQLGYQHRGIEDLMIRRGKCGAMQLAESIAGDSVIGHSTAYAGALEALAGVEISRRAQSIRAIALEMERAAIHIGDMGAIANDTAYLIGNAVFGATRTLVINSLLAVCGSRFGRGLIRPGGVAFDISTSLAAEIKNNLNKVHADTELMSETMFNTASVLSRLDQTGVVETQTAQSIGLVGPAARASGMSIDIRADHPFGIYRYYPVHKRVLYTGDVFARTYIRYIEIKQSIDYILEQFDSMSDEKPLLKPCNALQPASIVFSMTEGWRGETVHTLITDARGTITGCKVKDPSFNNWYGLALAVRNNGISDFPLCNKSFNLSYAGHDL